MFSQGRVNQELGREGILPFSKFWGSNRPFNAPLAGLSLHWAVCLIVIFALPPGDAYNFVINVVSGGLLPHGLSTSDDPLQISYPLSIINAVISFGIVWLAFRPKKDWPRQNLFVLAAAAFFGAVNVFLFIVPLTPPPAAAEPYESMPYWTHAVAGWAVFGIGLLYWVVWAQILPRVFGYKLKRVEEVGTDGLIRNVFRRVKQQ